MGLTLFLSMLGTCVAFVTLLYFLAPDLAKYYVRETKTIFNNFKKNKNNFGEILAVLLSTLLISIGTYIFYRITHSLFAYGLSENLLDFFAKDRGVFSDSSYATALQNPYLPLNFLSGAVVIPLVRFVAIFLLVEVVKGFMIDINKKFDSNFFSATSVIYFSSFGILLFALIETIAFLQSTDTVNTLANITFLIGAKAAYLLMAFAIWHNELVQNKIYKQSMLTHLGMNKIELFLLSHPKWLLIVTCFFSIMLNLPLYLGYQWNPSNWVVFISLLLGLSVFLPLLKFTILKGYNFLGVFMLDENRDSSIAKNHYFVKSLRIKRVKITVILFLFISLCFSFKTMFFFLFYVSIFAFFIINSICAIYLIGSILSKSKIYLLLPLSLAVSALKSIAPLFIFCCGTILLFSLAPKKLTEDSFPNYQSAVFDKSGNLIYKETNDGNPSISVSFEELPDFFTRAIVYKEDRAFYNQNNFWFNTSNWHGTSVSFLKGRGGSNIDQQVLKNLLFPKSFPQELQRKNSELMASYQLSYAYDPETILEYYVNNVSFNGGKGHKGIVNASFHTFGRNINQLNELEQLYLIFTLHRGKSFKIENSSIPYSNIENYSTLIKDRLLMYAESWHKQELLSKNELLKVKRQSLDFTNTRYKTNNTAAENIFFSKQSNRYPGTNKYYTSITKENRNKLNTALSLFQNDIRPNRASSNLKLYSAALVINIANGKILAHHGGNSTSDLTDFQNGFPMASEIKPFVLLELLEQGHQISLYDGFKGKRVANNFDHTFSNSYLNINEILGESKNAPLCNIFEITEPTPLFLSVEERFSSMDIKSDIAINLLDTSKKEWNRINYPLGSRRMNLIDLAQAYQTIFNDGEYIELSAFDKVVSQYDHSEILTQKKQKRIYSKENCKKIKRALKATLQINGTASNLNKILSGDNYFGKTATSDDNRHGFMILSDGKTLVVTWVSYGEIINGKLKLGRAPIPGLSGSRSAGKLAAYIMREIKRN